MRQWLAAQGAPRDPAVGPQNRSLAAVASRAFAPTTGVDDASNLPAPPAPAPTDQWPGLGAAIGNPNIARQGARARAIAATRPPPSLEAGANDGSDFVRSFRSAFSEVWQTRRVRVGRPRKAR